MLSSFLYLLMHIRQLFFKKKFVLHIDICSIKSKGHDTLYIFLRIPIEVKDDQHKILCIETLIEFIDIKRQEEHHI